MKKQLLSFLVFLLLIVSCNNNADNKTTESAPENSLQIDNTDGKTGTFTANQTQYKGVVTTQYFGSKEKGNFSVLCQQDADNGKFTLLQTTFITEKDALEMNGFKLYHKAMLPMTEAEPGLVAISLNGNNEELGATEYTGSSTSTGSIAVKNRTLLLKNIQLFNQKGEEQIVNATIAF